MIGKDTKILNQMVHHPSVVTLLYLWSQNALQCIQQADQYVTGCFPI